MQMEEQILDFLDGNLSAPQEEELLHRLAVSPERRTMLRQHLQVREMVGALAKKQQVAVPIALTASLFATVASLGYTGPQPMKPNIATAPTSAMLAKPIASGRSRFLRPVPVLALALLCLFAGSGITYLVSDGSRAGIGNSIKNTPNLSATQQSTSTQLPITASNTNTLATSRKEVNDAAVVGNTVGSSVSNSAKRNTSAHSVANDGNSNVLTNDSKISVNSKEHTNAPASISDVRDNDKPVENPPAPIVHLEKTDVPDVKPASDIHGDQNVAPDRIKVNPFDPKTNTRKNYTQPFSFSLRTGGGKVPGSDQGYTGSLIELRGSMFANNWLSFTVSVGQFMPYESTPSSAGVNSDGAQLYKLAPVLNYKNVVGLEVGSQFSVLNMPFDVSVGAMTNFAGTIIPRASLFTSLDLQENLALKVGIEGMFYSHDVSSSLNQQLASSPHSQLIGKNRAKETDGFFGPAVELFWRF